MKDGAFGLSTHAGDAARLAGHDRRPGRALQGGGASYHGIYSTHNRNEGTEVFAAIKEAIAIGERAGVPVDIIHIKIADQKLWGRMNEIVALIDAARKRGVNVQANVYPYTRGNNNLASIIPPWAHEGGTAKMLDRLKDPNAARTAEKGYPRGNSRLVQPFHRRGRRLEPHAHQRQVPV